MKETQIYLLHAGNFGDSGVLYKIFKHKKDVVTFVKEYGGYKQDKKRLNFYENHDSDAWLRIDKGCIYGD